MFFFWFFLREYIFVKSLNLIFGIFHKYIKRLKKAIDIDAIWLYFVCGTNILLKITLNVLVSIDKKILQFTI